MPTFGEIKARVGEYMTDLPDSAPTLIGQWINHAARDAMERHNFRFMEATAAFTTSPGQRVLGAIPADWKEARALPWHIDGEGGGAGATPREFDWAATETETVRLFGDDSVLDRGAPKMLRQTETQLLIYPFPDDLSRWSDGNYRVRVPYWKYLPDLTGDADTNWFTLNADWYLTHAATASGLTFNRDEQRAAVYLQMAERELRRLISKDKRAGLTIGTIGFYRDVHATRRQARSF